MSRMTAFEEETVELPNGESIVYRKRKGGTHKLILIHGNMNSSVNWDVLMTDLAADFTVYALDLRGFGASTYNTPIEGIKDFSDDIKAWADKMGFSKFSIAGWSMGGNVAMRFAIDYPDMLEKMILMSSGSPKGYPLEKRKFFGLLKTGEYLKTKEEIANSVKMFENIRKKNKRKALRLILNKGIYTHKKPLDGRMVKYEKAFMQQRNLVDVNYAMTYFNIAHENNGVTDGTGEVDSIKTPTLILHGTGDKVVSIEKAEETKSLLGDSAQLETFDEAGHALPVDKLPETSKAFEEFLLE